MYIFTTLEFPTHYSDFHLLTTSVNAKYYYKYNKIHVLWCKYIVIHIYIYIYIYISLFLFIGNNSAALDAICQH